MIAREILKQIRQIELRTNRLMRATLAGGMLALLLLVANGDASGATSWRTALREQTDPAKLAALGQRGANPRVNRIVYYLHLAGESGTAPAEALDWAFGQNNTTGLVAVLSKATQLLNYQHAVDWGLLTGENLDKLRRGQAPTITRGPHEGQQTDVDHIIPFSRAPEAGNSLANLELMPASLNRSKGADIGWREFSHAGRLHEAGVIGSWTLWRVRWVFLRGWMLLGLVLVVILGRAIWSRTRLRRLAAVDSGGARLFLNSIRL